MYRTALAPKKNPFRLKMSFNGVKTIFDKLTCCISLKAATVATSTIHVISGIIMTIETIHVAIYHFQAKRIQAAEDEFHLVTSFGTASSMELIFGVYMFIGVLKENVTFILSGLTLEVMTILMQLTALILFLVVSSIHGYRLDNKINIMMHHGTVIAVESIFILIVYNYYRRLVKPTHTNTESPAELMNSTRESDDVEVEYF